MTQLRRFSSGVSIALLGMTVLAAAGWWHFGLARQRTRQALELAAHQRQLLEPVESQLRQSRSLHAGALLEKEGAEYQALVAGLLAALPELQSRPAVHAHFEGLAQAAHVVTRSWQVARHDHGLTAAALSPDGRRVVTAGYQSPFRVWDAAHGTLLFELPGQEEYGGDALFSPDGRWLMTSARTKVQLWDARSGKLVRVFAEREQAVTSASFSTDSKRLVTASWDGTLKIWNVESGELLYTLKGAIATIGVAGCSVDGKSFVTAGRDGTAQVWDLESGKIVQVLAWNDDRYVPHQVKGNHLDMKEVGFSPDGLRIVTATTDGIARVWDARSGEQQLWLKGHSAALHSASFSPDGRLVLTSSEDGTARLWDVGSGKQLRVFAGHSDWVRPEPEAPSIPESERSEASLPESDSWWIYEQRDNAGRYLSQREGRRAAITAARFSADGRRVVTASSDGSARIWDLEEGTLLRGRAEYRTEPRPASTANAKPSDIVSSHLFNSRWISAACFSAAGEQLVTGGEDGSVRVWDLKHGTETTAAVSGGSDHMIGLGCSPDGTKIVAGGTHSEAQVWELKTGNRLRRLGGHRARVRAAGFSADGKLVVTGGDDGMARVWDGENGQRKHMLEDYWGRVLAVAFSPDGNFLFTGGYDSTARMWDLESGKEQRSFKGHHGRVVAIGSSPDGKQVVTGSSDGTVRLWNPQTGVSRMRLHTNVGKILAVHYLPDGKRLLVAGVDEQNWIWAEEFLVDEELLADDGCRVLQGFGPTQIPGCNEDEVRQALALCSSIGKRLPGP